MSIGKGTVSTIKFKNTAKFFIESKYKQDNKATVMDEKQRMITIVGSLSRTEIGNTSPSEFYPSNQDLSNLEALDEWVPPTLRTLLDIIVTNKEKKIAVWRMKT